MDRASTPLRRTRGWGLAALLGTAGCGDDAPPPAVEGSSGENSTTTTAEPPDDSSTGVATTAVDSGSSDEGLPPLEVEVSIYTYPTQPMVIDLGFSAPELTLSVEHLSDEGVRADPIAGAEGESWMRVRGLSPSTGHILRWSAEDAAGRTDAGDLLVRTEGALPGFVPSFPIEGTGLGYGGYVMFDLLALTPRAPASLFVVDPDGITRWHIGRIDESPGPNAVFAGVEQRPDGTLLFLRNYSIFIIDELGAERLSITSEQAGLPGMHHDVIELDSGNLLTLSYTFRDIEYPDIGLTHVAGDLIVELTPEGDVVWEWDAFDHLDPQRRRAGFEELIFDPDRLVTASDWTHGNGLVHDPATDTVLFSSRHQDWLVLIDRATGDVLWRLGEEGDFGLEPGGLWPYHQHSPQWQDDGSLLLYDNGLGNPTLPDVFETSRAVRYALDTETMMATEVWEDEADDFISIIAGDADRLPDGSILVTDSAIDFEVGPDQSYARIREIDEDDSATPQWSFTTALGTFVYRCIPTALLPGQVP